MTTIAESTTKASTSSYTAIADFTTEIFRQLSIMTFTDPIVDDLPTEECDGDEDVTNSPETEDIDYEDDQDDDDDDDDLIFPVDL